MTDRPDRSERSIDRRRLLKLAGATALGGAAFSDVAAAHGVTHGPVFCGCSQVCVCGDGHADVIVATEDGDDGFDTDDINRDFDFCYEVDEGKIIAIVVDSTAYRNPNDACAGDAFDDWWTEWEDDENDWVYGERGGPCGKPPCEHPGQGHGPDNGNGPPNGR